MNKIGILTLNGNENYGNKLQNYALQQFLSENGFLVETILNRSEIFSQKSFKSKIDKIISLKDLKNIYYYYSKIIDKINKNKRTLRNEKINTFVNYSKKYINESKFIINSFNDALELNDKYDFFITGSDQVWNPYWRNGSGIDFLQFADFSKRISYAPSFGVSYIPEKYINDYKLYLKDIKFLSVREFEGKEIVKELTGRDSELVLDPTFLIKKEQWVEKSFKSKLKDKDFILTYFLGETNEQDKKVINYLKSSYSNENLIELNNYDYMNYFTSSPIDFIYLINNSNIVFTDSFHGAVFSIILNIPFIVVSRKDKLKMDSRIDTLVKLFGIKFLNDSSNFNSSFINNNFDEYNLRLEFYRQKSIKFLSGALNKELS